MEVDWRNLHHLPHSFYGTEYGDVGEGPSGSAVFRGGVKTAGSYRELEKETT